VPTYSQAQDAVETSIEFFLKQWHFRWCFWCIKCNKRKPTRPSSEILNYLSVCKEGKWVMMHL
jgi:hypothetical protein